MLYIVPIANVKWLKILCLPRKPGELAYVRTKTLTQHLLRKVKTTNICLKHLLRIAKPCATCICLLIKKYLQHFYNSLSCLNLLFLFYYQKIIVTLLFEVNERCIVCSLSFRTFYTITLSQTKIPLPHSFGILAMKRNSLNAITWAFSRKEDQRPQRLLPSSEI